MHSLLRLVRVLDKHSGLISSVGLVLAAMGVLLTLYYLRLYSSEIRRHEQEQERLAWERILKLVHRVIEYAAQANLSSVAYSPLGKVGFLQPDIAAKYGPAQESLLSYWHELRVELSMMPDSPFTDEVQQFIAKYDGSADARASVEFQVDIIPIAYKISQKARKSFDRNAERGAGQSAIS